MTSATETTVSNALPKLQVQRGLEQFELAPGQDLKPGDVIRNLSDQPARVGAVSRVPELPSQVATMAPGSAIRVTDRGEPTDEVLGLQSIEGNAMVADASDEIAGATEYVITPEVMAVAGLFGAAPLLAGAAAPIAGAVGLAALLAGNDSDGNGDAAATTNGGGGGVGGGGAGGGGGALPDGSAADNLRNGVSGLLDSVNTGLNDTPLAPATALTDALAEGVNTVANQINSITANDPTGITQILAGALGFTQPGSDNSSTGLSGGVDALSAGLTDATAGTPLAAVVDPLTGVLGGNAIDLGGLASGLADLGSALPTGDTPLAGLFDSLLTPLVGTSPASTGAGADPASALLDTLTGAAAPLSSLAGGGDALTSALGNLAPI